MQSLIRPNAKFLRIFPENWEELVFEYDDFYMINVTGKTVTEEQWNYYEALLRSEFGDNFDEVYPLAEEENTFQVFLKKDKSLVN